MVKTKKMEEKPAPPARERGVAIRHTPATTTTQQGDKGKSIEPPKKKKNTALWRENEEALKKAGLWAFIQGSSSRPWLYEQIILPFSKTMDDPEVL